MVKGQMSALVECAASAVNFDVSSYQRAVFFFLGIITENNGLCEACLQVCWSLLVLFN